MAKQVKIGQLAKGRRTQESDKLMLQAIAKLGVAIQTVATALDGDSGVTLTTYRAAVDLILDPIIIP